jgi:transposase
MTKICDIPPDLRFKTGVKVRNFKALYRFEGYVVEELSCQEIGAQIKLRFDERKPARCPECNDRLPRNRLGSSAAMDLPLGEGLVVWIIFPTIQGYCRTCQCYQTTRPAEIHPETRATWRFMRTVSDWASVAPATAVAAMFEISDHTVRRYDKKVLEADLPAPQLDGLRAILIDEKAVRRGHNYMTVVINADTGELLYMAEGRKKKTLAAFFDQLTAEQRASIEAVGIDRSGAYQAAIEEYLPGAAIVYDRFHLVANINAAIDEVRRTQWREASAEDKAAIKGSRYILYANSGGLEPDPQARLDRLLEANQPISLAYQLKEQFRVIFEYRYPASAAKALESWCEMAQASGMKSFERLARSFRKGAEKVVAFIKHRVTSGRIEGLNNQVARVVHRACGVRDLDYLFLRLRHQTVMR